MKKLLIAIALVMGISGVATQAQSVKEIVAESFKKNKCEKYGKKESKAKLGEGWKAYEGSAPLEKQFAESYARELATDDNEEPYFYQGVGSFSADDLGAAYKFASERAMQDIAAKVEKTIAEAIDANVDAVGGGQTAAANKASSRAKSVVTAKLKGVRPIVKMYKKTGYQYEVSVVMYYSRRQADQEAARAYAEAAASESALDKRAEEALNKLMEEK